MAHIPCSFAYQVVCIDGSFNKPVVHYRGKNAVNTFIEAILKENGYCKKLIKKLFNKNLLMSVEDEKNFNAGYVINYLLLEIVK